MAGLITNSIVFMLFLFFAILLSSGKGAFLIAGYNTLPESDKAQYDEVALCKFMGKIMYGFCCCVVLWGISEVVDNQIYLIVGLVLFLLLVVFSIAYTNTSNRFKREGAR